MLLSGTALSHQALHCKADSIKHETPKDTPLSGGSDLTAYLITFQGEYMQCHYVREVHNLIPHRKSPSSHPQTDQSQLHVSSPSQANSSLILSTLSRFQKRQETQRGHQQQTKEIIRPKSSLETVSELVGVFNRRISATQWQRLMQAMFLQLPTQLERESRSETSSSQ